MAAHENFKMVDYILASLGPCEHKIKLDRVSKSVETEVKQSTSRKASSSINSVEKSSKGGRKKSWDEVIKEIEQEMELEGSVDSNFDQMLYQSIEIPVRASLGLPCSRSSENLLNFTGKIKRSPKERHIITKVKLRSKL